MKPKVVIWGASGHALVVADIIKRAGQYELVACLDDVNTLPPGAQLADTPVLPSFSAIRKAHPDVGHVLIGIGSCKARIDLSARARAEGFTLARAVHPSAILADVEIGEGTVIAAGAIINPQARIGANVIINTGATVDHDCILAEGVHICPGVHLAGNVEVGQGTWVGIGSTVIDKIKIGEGTVIGAGSVVVEDIPSGVVAFGVPARIRRTI